MSLRSDLPGYPQYMDAPRAGLSIWEEIDNIGQFRFNFWAGLFYYL